MDDARVQELQAIALNGRSTRIARYLKLNEAGDTITGLVVATGMMPRNRYGQESPYADLKCVAGSLGGSDLVVDDWYRVVGHNAALRNYFNRDAPQVGDLMVLEHRGRATTAMGAYRHDIVCGTVRSHELGEDALPVAAGSERPW